MRSPRRRCLECGALTTGSRCPAHRKAQRAKYGGNWPAISKARIAAHVAAHGWTCPGWRVPAHESHDLTLDHHVGVLCRACNSRKRRDGA